MSYVIILLMIISASAHYVGVISYISLLALIVLNFRNCKFSYNRYFIIFLFSVLYGANILVSLNSKNGIDLVIANFFLQILFILTVNYNEKYISLIIKSIELQVVISFLMGIVGFLNINQSMFIDAGATKGFAGMHALIGIYSTPQLLASLCIASLIFNNNIKGDCKGSVKSKLFNSISLVVLVLTLNRVNIFSLVAWCLIREIYKKAGWLITMLLFFVSTIIVFYYVVFIIPWDGLLLRTMQSRYALITGVISEIDLNSPWQVVFGLFDNISFYLPDYMVNITYVENGGMFIFKYFGLIGLFLYIVFAFVLAVKLYKNKAKFLSLYALFYLLIIQNFTHEFLSFVFSQIIVLLIYHVIPKHNALQAKNT